MEQEDRARREGPEPSEARWLSAAEKRAWLSFWGATRLVDDALDRDLQACSGLSHGEYQLLAMLSGAPDRRMRMSALAGVALVSRSRLTYQVESVRRVFFDALTPEQVAVLGDALTGIVERLLDGTELRNIAELWAAQ